MACVREGRLTEDSDTMGGESFCEKNELPVDDFRLEEVFMQDGDLYAKINNEDGDFTSKALPYRREITPAIKAAL